MKILFVCHGNINRSAAAEIVSRDLHPDWEARSAGVAASPGRPTAPKMREALEQLGYKETQIGASPFTKELEEWADVVYYMDDGNLEKMVDIAGMSQKYKPLGPLAGADKVPDPHFKNSVEACLQCVNMIERAIRAIDESTIAEAIAERLSITLTDIDDVEIDGKTPAEAFIRFASLIEEKLLMGVAKWEIYHWASKTLGVPADITKRAINYIRGAWNERLGGTKEQKRDGVRVLYLRVYREALQMKKLDLAGEILDKLVALDDLSMSEAREEGVSIGVQITNAPRQEMGGILARVGELMSSRTIQRLKDTRPEYLDVKGAEVKGS